MRLFSLIVIMFLSLSSFAQGKRLTVSYINPLGVELGGVIGLDYDIFDLKSKVKNEKTVFYQCFFKPQVIYTQNLIIILCLE